MATFQDLLDRARIPLNDADKVRYPDAELIQGANRALQIMRQRRPDLFLGNWTLAAYTVGQTFPLTDEFRTPVEDYITAWAEMRDDEAAIQTRARAFFEMFGSLL